MSETRFQLHLALFRGTELGQCDYDIHKTVVAARFGFCIPLELAGRPLTLMTVRESAQRLEAERCSRAG